MTSLIVPPSNSPSGVPGAKKALAHKLQWKLRLTGDGRELFRALQELQEAAAAPSGSISLLVTLICGTLRRLARGT